MSYIIPVSPNWTDCYTLAAILYDLYNTTWTTWTRIGQTVVQSQSYYMTYIIPHGPHGLELLQFMLPAMLY